MRPPICEVCGADADRGGDLVAFADFEPLSTLYLGLGPPPCDARSP